MMSWMPVGMNVTALGMVEFSSLSEVYYFFEVQTLHTYLTPIGITFAFKENKGFEVYFLSCSIVIPILASTLRC